MESFVWRKRLGCVSALSNRNSWCSLSTQLTKSTFLGISCVKYQKCMKYFQIWKGPTFQRTHWQASMICWKFTRLQANKNKITGCLKQVGGLKLAAGSSLPAGELARGSARFVHTPNCEEGSLLIPLAIPITSEKSYFPITWYWTTMQTEKRTSPQSRLPLYKNAPKWLRWT